MGQTESHSDDEDPEDYDGGSGDDTPMDWESSVKSDPCFAAERQEELREKLGLASPDMAALIRQSEFVSLGSHCGVAMTLENMGLRRGAYPFDWARSPANGILHCLESNFGDFLTYSKIQPGLGGQKFFFGSSWGGSFWHHDLEDQSVRETFSRRIQRLLRGGGNHEDVAARIFVRVANSSTELALAPKLLATLRQKLAQTRVFLLVIIDMQKQTGLVHVENTSNNLIFYHVHEDLWLHGDDDILEQRHRSADTYALGIAAALRYWGDAENSNVEAADEETSSFITALKYVAQQLQPSPQATIFPDIATLIDSTEPFDGGNCSFELYKPQHKPAASDCTEPIIRRLPKGATAGYVKTHHNAIKSL